MIHGNYTINIQFSGEPNQELELEIDRAMSFIGYEMTHRVRNITHKTTMMNYEKKRII